jgi:hypothetical protein
MLSVKLCRPLLRMAATIHPQVASCARLPGQPNRLHALTHLPGEPRSETLNHQTVSGGEQTGCCSCTPTQRLMAACTWGRGTATSVAGRCRPSVRCRGSGAWGGPPRRVRIGSFRWPGTTPPPYAWAFWGSVEDAPLDDGDSPLPRTARCLWRLLRRSKLSCRQVRGEGAGGLCAQAHGAWFAGSDQRLEVGK